MVELIPINIVIADRSYRVKVEKKDEEIVRASVKLINDKILEFRGHFAGKDMQDYIAMVLIWFATDQQKNTTGSVNDASLTEKLQSLEQLIDRAIK
ncbi:MAG: cell division protein ZapA [Chitinophagaceae bacterium]|nr:cell division protein ZapA [Chitinophagaceae bacterium]